MIVRSPLRRYAGFGVLSSSQPDITTVDVRLGDENYDASAVQAAWTATRKIEADAALMLAKYPLDTLAAAEKNFRALLKTLGWQGKSHANMLKAGGTGAPTAVEDYTTQVVAALKLYGDLITDWVQKKTKEEKDAADKIELEKAQAAQDSQDKQDKLDIGKLTEIIKAKKEAAETAVLAKKAAQPTILGYPLLVVAPVSLTLLVLLYLVARPRRVVYAPVAVRQPAVAGYRPGRKLLKRKRK
jgi:hypothetical protein